MFRIHIAVASVFAFLLVTGRSVGSDVPIEGKSDLLALVLASQRTNTAAFSSADFTADVEILEGSESTKSHVDVMFNGEGTYWRYETRSNNGVFARTSSGEIIRRGDEWILYTPVAKLVQVTPEGVFALPSELSILPQDLWFRIDGRINSTDFLDPKVKSELVDKYVVKEEGDGQEIVVVRHFKSGVRYLFRFSLAHGCNLVAYETNRNERNGLWMRGRFDWVTNQAGESYVKSLKTERSIVARGAKMSRTVNVTVTRFVTSPKIPKDRFLIDSLDLPEGTIIKKYGPDKKVIPGAERRVDWKVTQQDFDRLIRVMQQGRLAKADR